MGDEVLGVHGEDGVRRPGRGPDDVVLQQGAVGEHAGPGPVPERRHAADGVPGGLPDEVHLGPGDLVGAEFLADELQVDAGGPVHEHEHGHPSPKLSASLEQGGPPCCEDQRLADLAQLAPDRGGGLGGGTGGIREPADLSHEIPEPERPQGLGESGVGS